MISKVIGFEVQKGAFELAYNSVKLNNLEKQIQIINANLNEVLEYAGDECSQYGLKALKFAESKNYISQARSIIDFIEEG